MYFICIIHIKFIPLHIIQCKDMTEFKLIKYKDDILNSFDSGESCTSISRRYNCYLQAVTNLVKHFRPNSELHPYIGNINYFHTINSYAKAYIVGFIAADGSLVKTKTTTALTITIKYEDKAVLEFIKSEIGNTHKLHEIIRKSSFNKNLTIHHIRYCIANRTIERDLNNLGIYSNKSLTMGNIIKNIPYNYRDAFIIGYFDGDGSATIRDGLYPNDRGILCKDNSVYIQMRGTREFLIGVCNHLDIDISHIHKNDSIPNLSVANKKDVIRFYKCYNNLPFYYKRKHDKFLQRINLPAFDKYK